MWCRFVMILACTSLSDEQAIQHSRCKRELPYCQASHDKYIWAEQICIHDLKPNVRRWNVSQAHAWTLVQVHECMYVQAYLYAHRYNSHACTSHTYNGQDCSIVLHQLADFGIPVLKGTNQALAALLLLHHICQARWRAQQH